MILPCGLSLWDLAPLLLIVAAQGQVDGTSARLGEVMSSPAASLVKE